MNTTDRMKDVAVASSVAVAASAPAEGMVTIPRILAENFLRSTEVPRFKRILEAALSSAAAPAQGEAVCFKCGLGPFFHDHGECAAAPAAVTERLAALEEAARICDDMVLYTGFDCAQRIREAAQAAPHPPSGGSVSGQRLKAENETSASSGGQKSAERVEDDGWCPNCGRDLTLPLDH